MLRTCVADGNGTRVVVDVLSGPTHESAAAGAPPKGHETSALPLEAGVLSTRVAQGAPARVDRKSVV